MIKSCSLNPSANFTPVLDISQCLLFDEHETVFLGDDIEVKVLLSAVIPHIALLPIFSFIYYMCKPYAHNIQKDTRSTQEIIAIIDKKFNEFKDALINDLKNELKAEITRKLKKTWVK